MVGKQSNPFELDQSDSSGNLVEMGQDSSKLTVALEKLTVLGRYGLGQSLGVGYWSASAFFLWWAVLVQPPCGG